MQRDSKQRLLRYSGIFVDRRAFTILKTMVSIQCQGRVYVNEAGSALSTPILHDLTVNRPEFSRLLPDGGDVLKVVEI